MMLKPFLGKSRRFIYNKVNSPAMILLYHRVTRLESDPQLLAVDPDNFSDQIKVLKQDFDLLTINDFVAGINDWQKMPKRAVILTFDDGYADNYLEATPILEHHNAEALFYITTSNINTSREFWWDELERIFLHEKKKTAITVNLRNGDLQLALNNDADRMIAYNKLHPILKYMKSEDRELILGSLRLQLNLHTNGRSSHRVLTSTELEAMSKSASVVIGAHTHNHPALSALDYDAQKIEIKTSKDFLENAVSKPVDHFSYPFGSIADFNEDSVKCCRELGFKMVTANKYDQVHKWSDHFRMPRILVRNWKKDNFIVQAKSFLRY